MISCFFVTDLHGNKRKYHSLFRIIEKLKPKIVFVGGDLSPHFWLSAKTGEDFYEDFLFPSLLSLKKSLKKDYPVFFFIMGNDDCRADEPKIFSAEEQGLLKYINQKPFQYEDYTVYGYSFIPPSPFQLKDWEKFDVSRYIDPGCVSPMEGLRTMEVDEDIEYATIKNDLDVMCEDAILENAILLFHAPPYQTYLDRAALDGQMIDYVPIDVHIGSIAIKRFIEERQPLISLHGHVHESSRLTGHWKQEIGRTLAINAAHDGPELSVIQFDLDQPELAERQLIQGL